MRKRTSHRTSTHFLLLTSYFLLLTTYFLLPTSSPAQAPLLINYQGRVVDGTNLVNGTISLRFRLFTEPVGGFLVYEGTNVATAVDGLYQTTIGEFSTAGTLMQGLGVLGGDGSPRWLELAVNGVTLTPRERLNAVPFSMATYGLWPRQNNSFTLGVFSQSLSTGPQGENAVVLGGQQNQALSTNSAVVAGRGNRIDTWSEESIVLGGRGNEIALSAPHNAIVGGYSNRIASGARASSISGGEQNVIEPGVRHASIGGGVLNRVDGHAATVAGGTNNVASGDGSFIGGGEDNLVTAFRAVIVGGWENVAMSGFSFVGGGASHVISNAAYGAIGGGFNNQVRASDATVGGGFGNIASGARSTIGGGMQNRANGQFATVPGGSSNVATNDAFAAGRRAKANHQGTFVWGDSTNEDFASTATNQFLIRAGGGVGINTNNPQATLHVAGSAMIGDNPQPATFGMQRINTGVDASLFTHPAFNVAMSWSAGTSRVLAVSNGTPNYVQASISLLRPGSANVEFVARDMAPGNVTRLTNSAPDAAVWWVQVGSDAFPEGFTFQGTGFANSINGLVTYWE